MLCFKFIRLLLNHIFSLKVGVLFHGHQPDVFSLQGSHYSQSVFIQQNKLDFNEASIFRKYAFRFLRLSKRNEEMQFLRSVQLEKEKILSQNVKA